jgi:hypothetical protein
MSPVHHRTVTVDGHEIFYREAGPADAPAMRCQRPRRQSLPTPLP